MNLKKEINKIIKPVKNKYFSTQKKTRIELFKKFGIDIKEILEKIEKLYESNYDKFEELNLAFAKLENSLKICESLKKIDTDPDKIIITTLISLAEAIYRILKPQEEINENLIKGFLKGVKNKLEYKIRSSYKKHCETGNCEILKTFDHCETLYLIRNDYIHNGNFIGSFFINENTDCMKGGSFYFYEKNNKTTILSARSECKLTYKEFLTIFFEAFKLNIEKYLKN